MVGACSYSCMSSYRLLRSESCTCMFVRACGSVRGGGGAYVHWKALHKGCAMWCPQARRHLDSCKHCSAASQPYPPSCPWRPPAGVLPAWLKWHADFAPLHQKPAGYAYPRRFPRILPFIGYNVRGVGRGARYLGLGGFVLSTVRHPDQGRSGHTALCWHVLHAWLCARDEEKWASSRAARHDCPPPLLRTLLPCRECCLQYGVKGKGKSAAPLVNWSDSNLFDSLRMIVEGDAGDLGTQVPAEVRVLGCMRRREREGGGGV